MKTARWKVMFFSSMSLNSLSLSLAISMSCRRRQLRPPARVGQIEIGSHRPLPILDCEPLSPLDISLSTSYHYSACNPAGLSLMLLD